MPAPNAPAPQTSMLRQLGVVCLVAGIAQAFIGVLADQALHTGPAGVIVGTLVAAAGIGALIWERFKDDGNGPGGPGGPGGGGGRRGRPEYIYIPVESRPPYPGRHL